MNNSLNIIIAGGKTGGHLFPGIVVARAVQSMVPDARILFVGTRAPFETTTLEKYGFDHQAIFSRPVKGGNIFKKAFSLGLVSISLIQALWIMKSFKPDFVLGVGGFSSFAVVLAAWMLGKPTAIQEQNAIPGLTNRMLARFASVIFTSFKNTKGFMDLPKTEFVGNPVRKPDPANKIQPLDGLEYYSKDRPTILVTGGSQGAKSINRAFIEALSLMPDANRFNIIHQTGDADKDFVCSQYTQKGLQVDADAFFDHLPQLFAVADLVIARAGAGTLTELCLQGAACILIPFPHAADNHQEKNAQALESLGAAVMIRESDLSGETLKKTMENIFRDKIKRAQMISAIKSCATPDADKKIATHIIRTKGIKV